MSVRCEIWIKLKQLRKSDVFSFILVHHGFLGSLCGLSKITYLNIYQNPSGKICGKDSYGNDLFFPKDV